MRKRVLILTVLATLFSMSTLSMTASSASAPFPGVLKNARYVYVTSYDGSQWNFNVSPENRAAIGEVQDAVRSWGHYMVVQKPRDADMILVVQRWGSEDELAVFDPQLGRDSMYLWRVMGHGGLDKGEMPLFEQLRKSVEKMESDKK
jgi:hypothetical protein